MKPKTKFEYRIHLHEQLHYFYRIVFSGKYDFTPYHIAVYIFLLNQNNRIGWVEWFKSSFDINLQGTCIGNHATYYKTIKDLQSYKLIKYIPGTNKTSAAKYHVIKLYDSVQVRIPLSEQVSVQISEQLSVLLREQLNEHLSGQQPHTLYNSLVFSIYDLIFKNKELFFEELKNLNLNNPQSIINRPQSTSEEKKVAAKKEDEPEVVKKLKKLWTDYSKMRTELGKSYKSKIAIEAQYQNLIKLANNNPLTACKILENSISNQWLKLIKI